MIEGMRVIVFDVGSKSKLISSLLTFIPKLISFCLSFLLNFLLFNSNFVSIGKELHNFGSWKLALPLPNGCFHSGY